MTFLRSSFGKCNWLEKISLCLIGAWMLTIIASLNYMFMTNPVMSLDADQNHKENLNRISEISTRLNMLNKQNDALQNILFAKSNGDGNNLIPSDERNSDNTFFMDPKYTFNLTNILSKNEPLLQYEEIRRQIKNDMVEMWYYVNGELNKMKKELMDYDIGNKISITQRYINEYKKSLEINIDKLVEVDGYSKWREKESREISNLVQDRFKQLQNPDDCNTAKKLICNLNKGCGFGCQIHHLVYCFLVAYGTKRTLILKSKGWKYQKDGWETVFMPLSETCLSYIGDSYAQWPGDDTKQVISLPVVDNVYPKPVYQPPAVPADIAQRLKKIHGYPLVWWVGQVLKYLMRPNENTKILLENKKKKIEFANPIVGVHVRRTDKVGTEAAFHDVDEYMSKVKHYFDNLEIQPKVRRVYLASDDPKVITTAKDRYPDYKIIADADIAQTASVARRYSTSSLHGIIIDIYFLSLCDHLVCTFSSQVCRAAYELMQTHHIDAYDRFTSLDDIYYYGGQNAHPHIAIKDHTPKKEGEIELKIGDKLEVYGNHWDGYSKGKNLRTQVVGLYPSFKVKNTVYEVDFPKYENFISTR